MNSKPSDLLPPIPYPTPDISPLQVWFNDPSLRNYPDPSVPSAAVKPIRATSLKRNKRQTQFPESMTDFFPEPELSFGSVPNNPRPQRQILNEPPIRIPQRHVRQHPQNPDVNLLEVFDTSETLQPLPASDPSFALPVVREDPHFNPNYNDAVFYRPTRRFIDTKQDNDQINLKEFIEKKQ